MPSGDLSSSATNCRDRASACGPSAVPGRSILVTPGIVELGDAHDAVHRKLGELSGATLDAIYVVNPARIPTFLAGAKAGGRAQVVTAARFSEAQAAIDKLYRNPSDVMLYENDLPDVLEETRLL